MIHFIHPVLPGVRCGCLRWKPGRDWAAPCLLPSPTCPRETALLRSAAARSFPVAERGSQGPTQKVVLASVGQKLPMRQREGVLHSWLIAGWVLLFQMLTLLYYLVFYLFSNVYLFSKRDSVCSKYS